MAEIHIALAAIYDATDDTVLMEWREDHGPPGGSWMFIGGKIEPDLVLPGTREHPEEAIRRELREELGIRVRRAVHLGTCRYSGLDDNYYVASMFLVYEWEAWDGEINVEAGTAAGHRIAWTSLENATRQPWAPTVAMTSRVMERAHNSLMSTAVDDMMVRSPSIQETLGWVRFGSSHVVALRFRNRKAASDWLKMQVLEHAVCPTPYRDVAVFDDMGANITNDEDLR